MDLTIGPARPSDAGEILTVQRAAFVDEGRINGSFTLPPMTETLDEVRAAVTDGTIVLVARAGHRLVGSVRCVVGADGTGHIGRLSVAPDLYGHGIGRRLMAAVEEAAAGLVERLELFTGATSEANLRLYRSLGYVDLEWRPAEAAAGLAVFEKRLR
jgi:ribosomal protein S18 acetylase RimI-like enzyme